MTEQEFDVVRAAIKSAYPSFNIMPDVYSIQLWYKMLSDLPYNLVEQALYEIFATSKYPPGISDIRSKVAEYQAPAIMDAGEAWGEVQKAISTYGYYRSEEALESLNELTRRAVQRIGFREICMDENLVATRAHFFRVYDAISVRAVNDVRIPPGIAEAKRACQLERREMEQLNDTRDAEETENSEEKTRASAEYIDRLLRENGFRRRQSGGKKTK